MKELEELDMSQLGDEEIIKMTRGFRYKEPVAVICNEIIYISVEAAQYIKAKRVIMGKAAHYLLLHEAKSLDEGFSVSKTHGENAGKSIACGSAISGGYIPKSALKRPIKIKLIKDGIAIPLD